MKPNPGQTQAGRPWSGNPVASVVYMAIHNTQSPWQSEKPVGADPVSARDLLFALDLLFVRDLLFARDLLLVPE
ncbi:MAG: hypothetical protein P1V97_09775 [Planctomycetota bacterium]|nr:hypothetical protein [Planctomycetota bacterium]